MIVTKTDERELRNLNLVDKYIFPIIYIHILLYKTLNRICLFTSNKKLPNRIQCGSRYYLGFFVMI